MRGAFPGKGSDEARRLFLTSATGATPAPPGLTALRGTEIMFERSRKYEQAGTFPRILNNKSESAT